MLDFAWSVNLFAHFFSQLFTKFNILFRAKFCKYSRLFLWQSFFSRTFDWNFLWRQKGPVLAQISSLCFCSNIYLQSSISRSMQSSANIEGWLCCQGPFRHRPSGTLLFAQAPEKRRFVFLTFFLFEAIFIGKSAFKKMTRANGKLT